MLKESNLNPEQRMKDRQAKLRTVGNRALYLNNDETGMACDYHRTNMANPAPAFVLTNKRPAWDTYQALKAVSHLPFNMSRLISTDRRANFWYAYYRLREFGLSRRDCLQYIMEHATAE